MLPQFSGKPENKPKISPPNPLGASWGLLKAPWAFLGPPEDPLGPPGASLGLPGFPGFPSDPFRPAEIIDFDWLRSGSCSTTKVPELALQRGCSQPLHVEPRTFEEADHRLWLASSELPHYAEERTL